MGLDHSLFRRIMSPHNKPKSLKPRFFLEVRSLDLPWIGIESSQTIVQDFSRWRVNARCVHASYLRIEKLSRYYSQSLELSPLVLELPTHEFTKILSWSLMFGLSFASTAHVKDTSKWDDARKLHMCYLYHANTVSLLRHSSWWIMYAVLRARGRLSEVFHTKSWSRNQFVTHNPHGVTGAHQNHMLKIKITDWNWIYQ